MYKLLQTIPGVGKITAAALTAQIIDIDRFEDKRNFAAYFGLVPKLKESADSKSKCGITHRGDGNCRRLVYNAVLLHIKNDPESMISGLFERVAGSKNRYGKRPFSKKGLTAASRKMLVVMYSMLKNRQEYRH